MTTAIIPGSLGAIAAQNNQSIAETFLGCDVVILIDTSGSMGSHDSQDGNRRYDVAGLELVGLQNTLPGKIAVIGFSDDVAFFPSGQPIFFGAGTDMAKALKFAKVADVHGIRFILISDGEPNDAEYTLEVAKSYTNRIDTIFVGNPENRNAQEFLKKLASVSGGKQVTANQARQLAMNIETLLLSSGTYG